MIAKFVPYHFTT